MSSLVEKGFGDVIVGAAVQAADLVGLFATRGQHQDRQSAGGRQAPDLTTHLDAGHERQHPVEQDDIGLLLGNAEQRFLTVLRFRNGKAFPLQIVSQKGDERGLVLHDEDQRLRAGCRWIHGVRLS